MSDTGFRVVDGDTLWVPGRGYVRAQGFDTAEIANPSTGKAAEPGAYRAREIANQEVVGFEDTGTRDKYGRTIGAFVDEAGNDVSRSMIERGYAEPMGFSDRGQRAAEGTRAARAGPGGNVWNTPETVEHLRLLQEERDALGSGVPKGAAMARGLSRASGSTFAKGVHRGMTQMEGSAGALLHLGGELFESDWAKEVGLDIFEDSVREGSVYAPEVGSHANIEGLGDTWTFVKETFGEQMPNLLLMVGTAGLTGVAARSAAALAGRKMIERHGAEAAKAMLARAPVGSGAAQYPALAEMAVKDTLVRRMAPALADAVGTAGKRGALGGVFVSSTGMNMGATQGEFIEHGLSNPGLVVGTGLAQGALDTVGLGLIAKPLFTALSKIPGISTKSTMALVAKEAAKGFGKGALIEGTTEAMQESITLLARTVEDPNFAMLSEGDKAETFVRLIDAALKGGIMGGGMAAPVGAVQGVRLGAQAKQKDQVAQALQAEAAAEAQAAEQEQAAQIKAAFEAAADPAEAQALASAMLDAEVPKSKIVAGMSSELRQVLQGDAPNITAALTALEGATLPDGRPEPPPLGDPVGEVVPPAAPPAPSAPPGYTAETDPVTGQRVLHRVAPTQTQPAAPAPPAPPAAPNWGGEPGVVTPLGGGTEVQAGPAVTGPEVAPAPVADLEPVAPKAPESLATAVTPEAATGAPAEPVVAKPKRKRKSRAKPKVAKVETAVEPVVEPEPAVETPPEPTREEKIKALGAERKALNAKLKALSNRYVADLGAETKEQLTALAAEGVENQTRFKLSALSAARRAAMPKPARMSKEEVEAAKAALKVRRAEIDQELKALDEVEAPSAKPKVKAKRAPRTLEQKATAMETRARQAEARGEMRSGAKLRVRAALLRKEARNEAPMPKDPPAPPKYVAKAEEPKAEAPKAEAPKAEPVAPSAEPAPEVKSPRFKATIRALNPTPPRKGVKAEPEPQGELALAPVEGARNKLAVWVARKVAELKTARRVVGWLNKPEHAAAKERFLKGAERAGLRYAPVVGKRKRKELSLTRMVEALAERGEQARAEQEVQARAVRARDGRAATVKTLEAVTEKFGMADTREVVMTSPTTHRVLSYLFEGTVVGETVKGKSETGKSTWTMSVWDDPSQAGEGHASESQLMEGLVSAIDDGMQHRGKPLSLRYSHPKILNKAGEPVQIWMNAQKLADLGRLASGKEHETRTPRSTFWALSTAFGYLDSQGFVFEEGVDAKDATKRVLRYKDAPANAFPAGPVGMYKPTKEKVHSWFSLAMGRMGNKGYTDVEAEALRVRLLDATTAHEELVLAREELMLAEAAEVVSDGAELRVAARAAIPKLEEALVAATAANEGVKEARAALRKARREAAWVGVDEARAAVDKAERDFEDVSGLSTPELLELLSDEGGLAEVNFTSGAALTAQLSDGRMDPEMVQAVQELFALEHLEDAITGTVTPRAKNPDLMEQKVESDEAQIKRSVADQWKRSAEEVALQEKGRDDQAKVETMLQRLAEGKDVEGLHELDNLGKWARAALKQVGVKVRAVVLGRQGLQDLVTALTEEVAVWRELQTTMEANKAQLEKIKDPAWRARLVSEQVKLKEQMKRQPREQVVAEGLLADLREAMSDGSPAFVVYNQHSDQTQLNVPVIYINEAMLKTPGKQLRALAHELGHVVMRAELEALGRGATRSALRASFFASVPLAENHHPDTQAEMFSEWFAEMFAEHLLRDRMGENVPRDLPREVKHRVGLVEAFMDLLKGQLRKLWAGLRKQGRFGEKQVYDETFSQFMKVLATKSREHPTDPIVWGLSKEALQELTGTLIGLKKVSDQLPRHNNLIGVEKLRKTAVGRGMEEVAGGGQATLRSLWSLLLQTSAGALDMRGLGQSIRVHFRKHAGEEMTVESIPTALRYLKGLAADRMGKIADGFGLEFKRHWWRPGYYDMTTPDAELIQDVILDVAINGDEKAALARLPSKYRAAYRELRKFLDAAHEYAEVEGGLQIAYRKGFFALQLNATAVRADEPAFLKEWRQILQEVAEAKAEADGKTARRISEAEAQRAWDNLQGEDGMLDAFGLSGDPGMANYGPALAHARKRGLTPEQWARLKPWLERDFVSVASLYNQRVLRRVEYQKRAGYRAEQFYVTRREEEAFKARQEAVADNPVEHAKIAGEWLKLREARKEARKEKKLELLSLGLREDMLMQPTVKWLELMRKKVLTGDLSVADYDHVATRILPALMGTLGQHLHPRYRRLARGIQMYQSVRTLTMAWFASIMDAGLIAWRTGDARIVAASALEALRAPKNMTRQERRDMYAAMGTLNEAVTDHYLNSGISQQQFAMGKANLVTEVFFRVNFMHQWTEGMRLMGAIMAQKYMIKHADQARAGNAESVTLLSHLGVTADQVLARANRADGSLNLDPALSSSRRLVAAVNTFVDEGVMRPDAAARPWWGSHPIGQVFFFLKAFMFLFQEVVIRSLWNTAKRKGAGSVPKTVMYGFLGAAPLLAATIPLTIMGYELRRQVGNLGEDDWFEQLDKKGPGGYAAEIARRSGYFGWLELPGAMADDVERDKFVLSSALGPMAEQAIEGVFGGGVFESRWWAGATPIAASVPIMRRGVQGFLQGDGG